MGENELLKLNNLCLLSVTAFKTRSQVKFHLFSRQGNTKQNTSPGNTAKINNIKGTSNPRYVPLVVQKAKHNEAESMHGRNYDENVIVEWRRGRNNSEVYEQSTSEEIRSCKSLAEIYSIYSPSW